MLKTAEEDYSRSSRFSDSSIVLLHNYRFESSPTFSYATKHLIPDLDCGVLEMMGLDIKI